MVEKMGLKIPKFWGSAKLEKTIGKDDRIVLFEMSEEGEIDIGKPSEVLATVWVSGGLTKNWGNFENSKVDVGISLPTNPCNIEEAYLWCRAWVGNKLREYDREIKEFLVKRGQR